MPKNDNAGKTAFLVIHGIGSQNPYETMDAFARGFSDYFRSSLKRAVSFLPILQSKESWTRFFLRMQVGEKKNQKRIIDLYEYYWAPYTQDRINFKDTIWWLIRTGLTPLKHFSQNLHDDWGLEKDVTGTTTKKTAARVFLREFARLIPLAVVVLLVFALGYGLDQTAIGLADRKKEILDFINSYWHHGRWFVLVIIPVLVMVSLSQLWLLIADILKAIFSGGVSDRSPIQTITEDIWRSASLVIGLGFLVIAFLIDQHWCQGQMTLWIYEHAKLLLSGLGILLGAWLLKGALTNNVADVAVYTTMDEKSSSFQAREEILNGAMVAIKEILNSPENYDQVIIAGHSLGSVVAYDLVNKLIIEAEANKGGKDKKAVSYEQLRKLKGMVTFGSPLDKTYYFFRQDVPDSQAIRGQILSYLHGFRLKRSYRDYYPYQFAKTRQMNLQLGFTPLKDFHWLNVYAFADPVSGYLDHYHVDSQFSRPYWFYGYCHLQYWGDKEMYARISKEFLLTPEELKLL